MATAIGIAQQVDWDVPEQTGLWSDAWVRFRRNRLAIGGLAVIIFMIVLAIGARLPATPGGLWHILHITGDPVSQTWSTCMPSRRSNIPWVPTSSVAISCRGFSTE